jgi:hypothetical protein
MPETRAPRETTLSFGIADSRRRLNAISCSPCQRAGKCASAGTDAGQMVSPINEFANDRCRARVAAIMRNALAVRGHE